MVPCGPSASGCPVGSFCQEQAFASADLNDCLWVARRRNTRLRSTAAIAFYHPKAVRQHSTQSRSLIPLRTLPVSCRPLCRLRARLSYRALRCQSGAMTMRFDLHGADLRPCCLAGQRMGLRGPVFCSWPVFLSWTVSHVSPTDRKRGCWVNARRSLGLQCGPIPLSARTSLTRINLPAWRQGLPWPVPTCLN